MIDIISRIVKMKMVTNIVVGIILFFVLKMFFQWITELRKIRKIKQANKAIMNLLKPYASNGSFPAPGTFHALMGAVANDHNVTCEELNSPTYYFQEFIKEILSDPYIPVDKKIEYTDNLRIQMQNYEEDMAHVELPKVVNTAEERRNVFNSYNQLNISIFFSSILVALFGFIGGFYDLYESIGLFLIVSFALLIFADLCLKKKRYKEIPRIFRNTKEKVKKSWKERKERKIQAKKQLEMDQFVKDKKQLLEDQKKLEQWKQQLEKNQLQLDEQRHALNQITNSELPVEKEELNTDVITDETMDVTTDETILSMNDTEISIDEIVLEALKNDELNYQKACEIENAEVRERDPEELEELTKDHNIA